MAGAGTLDEFARMADDAIDVTYCAALIAKDVYSGLDVGALLAHFDALAEPLKLRAEAFTGRETLEDRARALASYIFVELGFAGNETEYYDPRNSLLPDVLERRLGIPITLSIVYCEIARRLGIEAHGVSFPGHFLVRVERPAMSEAPLIVDPFFGGRILDDDDMTRMLQRAVGPDAVFSPALVARANPRAVVVRMLTNLKTVYLGRGDIARAHLAVDRIASFLPNSVENLRERGTLAAKLGALEAARDDLARVIAMAPESGDAERARFQLADLEAKERRPLN